MPLNELENIDKEKIAQRGEGKKYAILMAALKLFGEYGLKATSVRMIAEEANANVASIPYYYTSKENLYIEVVSYIGEQINQHMQHVQEEVRGLVEKKNLSKKDAMHALQMMMRNMAKIMIESDEPKAWAQIIMREQATPTEAFDILYEGFMKPMQKIAAKFLSVYTGIDPNSPEIKIRLHALKGQVLGFLVSRESILRDLGVKKLDQDDYKLIYAVIEAHIKGALAEKITL